MRQKMLFKYSDIHVKKEHNLTARYILIILSK